MYGVILPNDIGLEKNTPSERSLLTRSFSRGSQHFFWTNAQISMLRKSNTFGVDYFISKGGQATFEWPLKDGTRGGGMHPKIGDVMLYLQASTG